MGAGIGGLTTALLLASRGEQVVVLEAGATPGGKMREVMAGGRAVDAGPTVLTMRWVFEELFADAGATLSDHVTLAPAKILARHVWEGGSRLDLMADMQETADAIGRFGGAGAAAGFLAFCAQSRRIYRTLERSFIRGARPTPFSLVRGAGLAGLPDLWAIRPFETMWQALGAHFADPRLRQLFGRYATYCGSSPFTAPATLMLVAHVEREGVWLVEGGMRRLADALAALAQAKGATIRYGESVAEILVEGGRAASVRLATGERVEASEVVLNADAASLAAGLFGSASRSAMPGMKPAGRSLSAITWAMLAETDGFPLVRHTVFFSEDYPAEFTDLAAGKVPSRPTVYVCAQDRDDAAMAHGPERLLCLVNAPPSGDTAPLSRPAVAEAAASAFGLLERCGLRVKRGEDSTVTTTPSDFAALFPATGGALYGPAVHGAMASFRRPGARTRLPGLYLAGGSTHPGAGVPMAALSGRQAAAAVLADRIAR